MAPSYLSLAVALSRVCAKSLEASRTFFFSVKNIVVYKLLHRLYKPELKLCPNTCSDGYTDENYTIL